MAGTTPRASGNATLSRSGALYEDSTDALKAIQLDFQYWSGKLTETSFQLSLGIIGANWAVFGSAQGILTNLLARLSILLVTLNLGLNVIGAKLMSELHRQRIDYAGEGRDRWEKECESALGGRTPWPFTSGIERLGRVMRELKTWLPVLAGVLFLAALFVTC